MLKWNKIFEFSIWGKNVLELKGVLAKIRTDMGKGRTGNGERGAGNGERRTGNGKWGARNTRCEVFSFTVTLTLWLPAPGNIPLPPPYALLPNFKFCFDHFVIIHSISSQNLQNFRYTVISMVSYVTLSLYTM